MNRRENNTITMFMGVLAVLSKYGTTISEITALSEAVERYEAIIEKIRKFADELERAAAGVTASKHAATLNLVERTLLICVILHSLGRKNSDEQLMARCDINRSSMSRLRFSELGQYGEHVLNLLQEHADEISQYNISAEEYRPVLAAFNEQCDEQVQCIAKAKVARQLLHVRFREGHAILRKELDILIGFARETNPELYNEYFAVRPVKDLGIHWSMKKKQEPEKIPEAAAPIVEKEPVAA